MYIKKGDTVQVMAGKDKDKLGEVIRVDRKRDRVYVSEVNIVKRHKKAGPSDSEGGIIEKEAPLHISNVLLYSKEAERGVRVSYRFLGQNEAQFKTREAAFASFSERPERVEKVRVYLKTGEVFS